MQNVYHAFNEYALYRAQKLVEFLNASICLLFNKTFYERLEVAKSLGVLKACDREISSNF